MTHPPDDRQTLLNNNLVGLPYWRLVLNQYRVCYFSSPKRTFTSLAPAATILVVGLVWTLGGIWLENVAPRFATRWHWSFLARFMPFLVIGVGYLIFVPATVPLFAVEPSPVRFTLRTLLGLVAVVCVLLAIAAALSQCAIATDQRREEVAQTIGSHGKVFMIEFAPLSSNVRELRMSNVDDGGVRSLVAMPETRKLVVLDLDQPRITDESMVELRSLSHLRQLIVIGARISDESVANFEQDTKCNVVR